MSERVETDGAPLPRATRRGFLKLSGAAAVAAGGLPLLHYNFDAQA